MDDGPEFPSTYAARDPDRPAVVDASTGAVVTYGQLEERSRAFAQVLRGWGLEPGDHLALALTNRTEFLEICWAAQRIGLYYTAVNTHLTDAEAHFIVADCGARVLLVDAELGDLATALRGGLPAVEHRVVVGGAMPGHTRYADLVHGPTALLADESEGEKMLYTSGTTGVPKGVARPLAPGPPGSVFLIRPLMIGMGFDERSVLLSPAPLYHSAPLGYAMGVHRLGGTVVITPRFDAVEFLEALQQQRATHVLVVPTMFIRLLRVADRADYDVSSLRAAVHGAAPCPPAVKREMIDWWGPVLFEYYAGTEGAGMTLIDSAQWLDHPGSVGRPVAGGVHIVDDATGRELPVGEIGSVFFSGGVQFQFHRDVDKTRAAYGPHGWTTMGDIGRVDSEGYLYLTDRRLFTVISGGVNIYPQEVENVLATHPDVADVAAFGIPHPELGEQVIAVVELVAGVAPEPETAEGLLNWCRGRLSRQKLPRRIDFTDQLPRGENGKLYKRRVRERYLLSQR